MTTRLNTKANPLRPRLLQGLLSALVSVCVGVGLVGCVGTAPEVIEKIERPVEVTLPPAPPSKVTLHAETHLETVLLDTEQIPLNNCNGNSPAEVEIERRRELTYVITDKTGSRFGVEYGLVGALEREYNITEGASEQTAHTLRLQTEPNSHIVYTVAWKERWINGQATLQTGDKTTPVPYRVRNGLTFEIQGVEDVGCGSILLQE